MTNHFTKNKSQQFPFSLNKQVIPSRFFKKHKFQTPNFLYSIKNYFVKKPISSKNNKSRLYFFWFNNIVTKNLFIKQIKKVSQHLPLLWRSNLMLRKFALKKKNVLKLKKNKFYSNEINQDLRKCLKNAEYMKKSFFLRKPTATTQPFLKKTRYIGYSLREAKFKLICNSVNFIKSEILRSNRFYKLKQVYNLFYGLPILSKKYNKLNSRIFKITKSKLFKRTELVRYKNYNQNFYFKRVESSSFKKEKVLHKNYWKNKNYKGNKFSDNYKRRFKIRRYNLIINAHNHYYNKGRFINQFKQYKKKIKNIKRRFAYGTFIELNNLKLNLNNFKRTWIKKRLVLRLNKPSLKGYKGGFWKILASVKKNRNKKRYFLFLNKKENNVFLTCTDYTGNVIISKSAGNCRITTKKKKKATDTIKAVSRAVTRQIKKKNIKFIYSLYTKNWYTKNIKLVLEEFIRQNIQILSVKSIVNKPHSLPMRKKKEKRR